jgi:hypothetical protein
MMTRLKSISLNIRPCCTCNHSYQLIRPVFLLLTACFLVHAIPEKTSVIATTDNLAASRPITTAVTALGGGETCAAATVIGALPFSDTGNTCGLVDDYFALFCGGIGSPDSVYEYTPVSNITVNISLCGSSYDTLLHVYENNCSGIEMVCNDDYCGLGSRLDGVSLTSGNTYYIVVDGASGGCGDYTIYVKT